MATLFGMALGGWMSGAIFDLTGSYRAAFLHGFLWNVVNISIAVFLLRRRGGRPPRPDPAPSPSAMCSQRLARERTHHPSTQRTPRLSSVSPLCGWLRTAAQSGRLAPTLASASLGCCEASR
jgi:hypothetical protein